MRDIRGDLQDRVSFLEEQIGAAQSEFEHAVERLRRLHQVKIEGLQAELEAVTTLLEGEYRRQGVPERAQTQERRAAPEPQDYHRPVAAEAAPQREPRQEPEPRRRAAPAEAVREARPAEAEDQRRAGPAREAETYQRSAVAQHPAQDEEHPAEAPPPQIYRRAPLVREEGRREEVRRAQPQPQPLADFLIRKLSESGPLTMEDLCQLAVQEGYFAEGESPERGVDLTLRNVAGAGFIRQLPNGAFAPASVTDTIRLRRAI